MDYILSRTWGKWRWQFWLKELSHLTTVDCRTGQCFRHHESSERGPKVRVRLHSERAECFRQHASNTKSPGTREMYLRLAEAEIALAAREAALGERPEQQTPGEADDRDAATPTTPEEPLPHDGTDHQRFPFAAAQWVM
jgi:hypothetical protein